MVDKDKDNVYYLDEYRAGKEDEGAKIQDILDFINELTEENFDTMMEEQDFGEPHYNQDFINFMLESLEDLNAKLDAINDTLKKDLEDE